MWETLTLGVEVGKKMGVGLLASTSQPSQTPTVVKIAKRALKIGHFCTSGQNFASFICLGPFFACLHKVCQLAGRRADQRRRRRVRARAQPPRAHKQTRRAQTLTKPTIFAHLRTSYVCMQWGCLFLCTRARAHTTRPSPSPSPSSSPSPPPPPSPRACGSVYTSACV